MRLGIDTGGTFTDAVLYDGAQGIIKTAKTLTTHHDLAIGIRDVIDRLEINSNLLSQQIKVAAISTTLATNAIVEDRGGTVCLLLIGYKSDSLHRSKLKNAIRNDPVEFIKGGHNAYGDELEPLDIESAKAAIIKHGNTVSAFAVAGMFSVRNSAHEIALQTLVRELTCKPVTCTSELTAKLNAPRRATTAVLNARLIAPITQLITTVRTELIQRNINVPLMVVKGDGSMISAESAALRPVETILSGPAASIIGASFLVAKPINLVADIGGTTTDIAVLKNGQPQTALEGANIGGFKTFVETLDVYTVGLGGDSQVSFSTPLELGPNRVLPISSLGKQHPNIIDILTEQIGGHPREYQGCFILRRRETEDAINLNKKDRSLWDMLANGPVRCDNLFSNPLMLRAFNRLRGLDLVQLSAFTPTDAFHVLNEMDRWCKNSARLAAEIWRRGFDRNGKICWNSIEELCLCVIDRVVQQTCEALVKAIVSMESPSISFADLGTYFLRKGVTKHNKSLIEVQFNLKGSIAAVGAPASVIYPVVAGRLGTELEIPTHAEIGNAVGAAVGTIMQRVSGLITSPAEGIYRTHSPIGVSNYKDLEEAVTRITEELTNVANQRAIASYVTKINSKVKRTDIVIDGIGGQRTFIESQITVTAEGDVGVATKNNQ